MYTKKGRSLRKITTRFNKLRKYLIYRGISFKRKKNSEKVFCIGFIKTGTKSIALTLQQLGYDHLSFNPFVLKEFQKNNVNQLIDICSKFDSFDDIPWNDEALIPMLDEKYPGSKFIYLEREPAQWLTSFENWVDYLTDDFTDKEIWLEKFVTHENFVRNYFTGREEIDIIYIDIKKPTDYNRLLTFLGKSSAATNFPHVNKTKVK